MLKLIAAVILVVCGFALVIVGLQFLSSGEPGRAAVNLAGGILFAGFGAVVFARSIRC